MGPCEDQQTLLPVVIVDEDEDEYEDEEEGEEETRGREIRRREGSRLSSSASPSPERRRRNRFSPSRLRRGAARRVASKPTSPSKSKTKSVHGVWRDEDEEDNENEEGNVPPRQWPRGSSFAAYTPQPAPGEGPGMYASTAARSSGALPGPASVLDIYAIARAQEHERELQRQSSRRVVSPTHAGPPSPVQMPGGPVRPGMPFGMPPPAQPSVAIPGPHFPMPPQQGPGVRFAVPEGSPHVPPPARPPLGMRPPFQHSHSFHPGNSFAHPQVAVPHGAATPTPVMVQSGVLGSAPPPPPAVMLTRSFTHTMHPPPQPFSNPGRPPSGGYQFR